MQNKQSTKFLAASLAAALAMWAGCGKQEKPQVSEWRLFQNPIDGSEVKYPDGWLLMDEASRIKLYSSQESAEKFFDPSTPKPGGVGAILSHKSAAESGAATLADYIAAEKPALWPWQDAQITIKEEESGSLDGEPATIVAYETRVGSKTISGRRVFAERDQVYYSLDLAGFGEEYQRYREVFNSIHASVKLPKPKVPKAEIDPSLPSQTYTVWANDLIEIRHPDNFEFSNPSLKGDMIFSVKFVGYRQDCALTLDVRPGKGLTVEKAFDQVKGGFNPTSTGDVTLSGLPGKFLTYSLPGDITGKAYFVIKDDKLYRTVVTLYQPKKDVYEPLFQKMIGSLKLK